MNRDYATGKADSITVFTGVEIEKTPAFGLQTLFVVGVLAPETIIDLVTQKNASTYTSEPTNHLTVLTLVDGIR